MASLGPDTISSAGLGQFYADSVQAGQPAAIQPEAGGTPESMNYTAFGWGYWQKPRIPPVDLLKWLDTRWLTQVLTTLLLLCWPSVPVCCSSAFTVLCRCAAVVLSLCCAAVVLSLCCAAVVLSLCCAGVLQ